jgi:probable F420-dependent oxidoreductase
MAIDLGKLGIWSMEMRFGDKAEGNAVAAELDELGYGALWMPGGIDDAVLGDVERLLGATKNIVIATGILNIWKHEPADVAAWWKGLPSGDQDRVMLGLGVSHGPIIGDAWKKPLAVMRDYLDRLDAAGLPREAMCLAALGPKMLELAAERTAGAHPYLVTPEHSAQARKIMGPGALLAPEQGCVLEEDADRARELALGALGHYRQLPNYRNSWKRLGISEEDIDAGSPALIDALFARGSAAKIGESVKAHHDAGANHVCLQVVSGGEAMAFPRDAYRSLAEALL